LFFLDQQQVSLRLILAAVGDIISDFEFLLFVASANIPFPLYASSYPLPRPCFFFGFWKTCWLAEAAAVTKTAGLFRIHGADIETH